MTDAANDRPVSGLFSDLSRRFTPGSKVEIRPRLQAMFEGSEETASLQEVIEETRAERPQPDIGQRESTTVRPPPAAPTRGRQASPLQPTPTTEAQAPTIPKDVEPESAAQSEFPAKFKTGSPEITTEDRTAQPVATFYPTEKPAVLSIPTTKPGEAPAPKQVEFPDAAPFVSGHETSPQPLATRQPEPERMDQQTEQDDGRTVEPTASPTIHIGRVELRQPPAAVEPQPKQVPVQAAPPRRIAASGSARAQGSRLTDYLGWKK